MTSVPLGLVTVLAVSLEPPQLVLLLDEERLTVTTSRETCLALAPSLGESLVLACSTATAGDKGDDEKAWRRRLVKKASDALGGQTELGAELDLAVTTVCKWFNGNNPVADTWVPLLEELVHGPRKKSKKKKTPRRPGMKSRKPKITSASARRVMDQRLVKMLVQQFGAKEATVRTGLTREQLAEFKEGRAIGLDDETRARVEETLSNLQVASKARKAGKVSKLWEDPPLTAEQVAWEGRA